LIDRLSSIASSPGGPMLVGAWAFAEAIFFPVVPDVALDVLAGAAPRRSLRLFGALLIGALIGSGILAAFAATRPAEATSLLLALPAIDDSLIEGAERAFASGDLTGFMGFGLTRPLKVDTFAWTVDGGSPIGLAIGVLVNRLTRVAPTLVAAVVIGSVAPDFLRRHQRTVLLVYGCAWLAVYAVYWTSPPR
jgi:hypothetical protein